MTSGQGREPLPPPHGQSPYGGPPYGGPPSGQIPYGWGPAPSADPGPPPEPEERPLTVRAGLGAFVAAILLGLASIGFMVADWDTFVRQAVAQQAQFGGADPSALEFAEAMAETLAVAIAVFSVLWSGLQLLFVWFAWTGRNWARIVLWVLGGLGVVSGLSGLAVGAAPPSLTVLGVFQTLALVVGVVLLAAAPSNDWFQSEKRRRAVTRPR